MSKITRGHGKKGSRAVKRDAQTGTFVLGRTAFSRISAVEGVTLSKDMNAALRRTEKMPAAKRRGTLASKYGKK